MIAEIINTVNVWQSFKDFATELNWNEIFRLYTLMSIIAYPLLMVIMLYLYAHTSLLKGLDRYIEKKFFADAEKSFPAEKKNEKPNTEKGKDTEKEQAGKLEKQEDISTKERMEREGIPCLEMNVGDEYACMLTEEEKKTINGNRFWTLSNSFVGEINKETGKFKALKIGSTMIECGEETSSNENRLIYYVEITDGDKKWNGSIPYDNIIKGTPISGIMVNLKPKELVKTVPEKFVTECKGTGNIETVRYQNEKPTKENPGRVSKAVIEYCGGEKTLKEVKRGMNLRMDLLTSRRETTYWVHKSYNEETETLGIDFIAFAKPSAKGNVILAIGKSWRVDCNEEELKNNLDLTEKYFADLLDKKDYPQTVKANATKNTTETENPEEPVKKGKNTEGGDKAPKAKKAEENKDKAEPGTSETKETDVNENEGQAERSETETDGKETERPVEMKDPFEDVDQDGILSEEDNY